WVWMRMPSTVSTAAFEGAEDRFRTRSISSGVNWVQRTNTVPPVSHDRSANPSLVDSSRWIDPDRIFPLRSRITSTSESASDRTISAAARIPMAHPLDLIGRREKFRVTIRCVARWSGMTIAIFLAAALVDDWTQYRGTGRDGVWAEQGLFETFPKEGLQVRWRVPAAGGFSSPVIAQGRVYLCDSVYHPAKARERIRCFDEKSGEV